MYLIDTHAHLDMIKKMTPEQAVNQAVKEGVRYIINVGSSIEGSRKSIDYSEEFPGVFASVGLHPHYAEGFGKNEKDILGSLIDGGTGRKADKVVAIGEAGFDFYRDLSPRPDQEKAFRAQIELAIKYDIPIIIHNRDADSRTLKVLKDYAGRDNFRGVVHCFSSDTEVASQCLDLGLYISFTGVITFPNARETLDVVRQVPIDRMFVETDSPYLAPQARRGKENYPGYVKYVAEKIAEVKDMDIEEVTEITSRNAEEFFDLK